VFLFFQLVFGVNEEDNEVACRALFVFRLSFWGFLKMVFLWERK